LVFGDVMHPAVETSSFKFLLNDPHCLNALGIYGAKLDTASSYSSYSARNDSPSKRHRKIGLYISVFVIS
jgi:hypothetical protein